jgi:hypothetical protein
MAVHLPCKKNDLDPVVNTLRGVFGANIVRVPESRIQPLVVIARRGDRQSYRGKLAELFSGDFPALRTETSAMAELSGKRTRQVDAQLGLQILSGFLSGLGIPGGSIDSQFSKAQEVSFTFGNVERHYVDPTRIGNSLDGKLLDKQKPAVAMFFGDNPWDLLVVDSIIVSNSFTISVDRTTDASATLDIPAIQKAVGDVKADVKVSSATNLDVSFSGVQQLTFAFTCQRVFASADGRVTILDPTNQMLNAAVEGGEIQYVPDRILLSSEPALIEFEEIDP